MTKLPHIYVIRLRKCRFQQSLENQTLAESLAIQPQLLACSFNEAIESAHDQIDRFILH